MFAVIDIPVFIAGGAAVWFGKDKILAAVQGAEAFAAKLKAKAADLEAKAAAAKTTVVTAAATVEAKAAAVESAVKS
jgi:hypothetical protein